MSKEQRPDGVIYPNAAIGLNLLIASREATNLLTHEQIVAQLIALAESDYNRVLAEEFFIRQKTQPLQQ
ncbi:MAG: hypothetical protein Q8Q65_04765 [bacterium]|nr:hypothetical protein [bacterium]